MKKVISLATYEESQIVIDDIVNSLLFSFDFQSLNNKSFLIIGGSGFLGSNLVKAILSINHLHNVNIEVSCIYKSKKNLKNSLGKWINHPNLTLINRDISKEILLKNKNYNYVINLASIANPSAFSGNEELIINSNVIGSKNILNEINIPKLENYIYISSAEIYGITDENDITEESYGVINSSSERSIYALSKKLTETFTVAFAKSRKLSFNIIRPFHIYGPGMNIDDGKIHSEIVKAVVRGQNLTLFSKGDAKRSFCYISDAIRGLIMVTLKGSKGEIYNLGNPNTFMSIKTLIERVFKYQGVKTKLIFEHNSPYTLSPIKKNKPDVGKLNKLGWEPLVNIQNGFERTISHTLKANKD
jgi:nucleoside-diphosphate-sugar epimerase